MAIGSRGRMRVSNKGRFFVVLILLVVIVSGLTLLIASAILNATADRSAKVRLIMGVSAPKPPFIDRISHRFTGVDVDIAEKIAQEMNAELIVVEMPEDELIPALLSGRIDMIGGAHALAELGSEEIAATNSYYQAGLVGMARGADGIIALSQLQGLKTGVIVGDETSPDKLITGTPRAGYPNIIQFAHARYAVAQLRSGGVSAVFLDRSLAEAFAAHFTDLSVFELEETAQEKQQYVFYLRNNAAQLEKANRAIQEMIGDGSLAALIAQYGDPDAVMNGLETQPLDITQPEQPEDQQAVPEGEEGEEGQEGTPSSPSPTDALA